MAARWLGGGIMLGVLQVVLMRTKDMTAMGGVGRAATKLSRTDFMPLAMAAGGTAAIPAQRRRGMTATGTANLLLLVAFWAMVVKPG